MLEQTGYCIDCLAEREAISLELEGMVGQNYEAWKMNCKGTGSIC
jgi:hypothetical protein